jgi:hypothetical protein
MIKPSILDVIGKRIELRRIGQRWWGLCPFHSEKTPSFTVNEEKGLFHCFACGAGGDVIRFVELAEQTDFKGALKILGICCGRYKPKTIVNTRNKRAAALLATWMNDQHLKVGSLCRELSRQIALAEKIPDPDLFEHLSREWEILSVLHDDLQAPEHAADLWEARESIDAITFGAEPEPLPEFPDLTPHYRQYLAAAVR